MACVEILDKCGYFKSYSFETFIIYIYHFHEAVDFETYLLPEWCSSCKVLWDVVKPCIDFSACYNACLKV